MQRRGQTARELSALLKDKRPNRQSVSGNVSRVVSDAIRYIAYEEGRDALIASFGGKGKRR